MKAYLAIGTLFVAIISARANSPTGSASQVPMLCEEVALPTRINELLKTKFPQWRPKQASDMSTDDQQSWLGAHEKECPGIAVGQFESADALSYAVLLVAKSEPTGGYKIVAFSRMPAGDVYALKLLDRADGETYSGRVISKADLRKYSDFDGTKSIETKLDGVYVEWIEKVAQLYYWSGGRYRTLRVSD